MSDIRAIATRLAVAWPALPRLMLCFCLVIACQSVLPAGEAFTDPEVHRFNLRVGTQTFAPKYRFTTNAALVETADAIRGMGSDILKFYLGRGFAAQYGTKVPDSVSDLASLAADEPSCRRVLAMPFRHYLVWVYAFGHAGDTPWKDGFSGAEAARERMEIYGLCRYLLTRFNGSGKSFYLGHWEGDWHLLPNYNARVNPSPVAIQGMIDWLNTRQKAVDDALRDISHTNVWLYHYTEVNRVRDAMLNGPESNRRLVNTVLPLVTNIDFVSWSSYDGMDLGERELHDTLNYIQSQLPPAKAASISGKRVWIGEYGWGGTLTSEAQEEPTRAYLRKLLPWAPRFILFWQIYDNEGKQYGLIDSNGVQTASYFLHQRFLNQARLEVARFKETSGRLPADPEFASMMLPLLKAPLPAPSRGSKPAELPAVRR